jgi:CBS domain-containing membrane protein
LIRLFYPILPGSTLRDRAIACLGALLGIAVTGLAARQVLAGQGPLSLLLAAPMGASAVLVFAVPASPLAQPWSVLGGNVISALVGVTVARLIGEPMLAGGVAVGAAIAAMSLCRCLHPPGGAVALTAVVGGPAVAALGYRFALAPVAVDTLLLLAAGLLFHRLSGHSYPHHAKPAPAPPAPAITLQPADIDAALQAFGEPLDVDREDLDAVFRLAEAHALRRGAMATAG